MELHQKIPLRLSFDIRKLLALPPLNKSANLRKIHVVTEEGKLSHYIIEDILALSEGPYNVVGKEKYSLEEIRSL